MPFLPAHRANIFCASGNGSTSCRGSSGGSDGDGCGCCCNTHTGGDAAAGAAAAATRELPGAAALELSQFLWLASYCFHIALSCVGQCHIKAQLKMRKVPLKQTDKLGVLEELWKQYDASHKHLLDVMKGNGAAAPVAVAAAAAASVAVAAAQEASAVRKCSKCNGSDHQGNNASCPVNIAAAAAASVAAAGVQVQSRGASATAVSAANAATSPLRRGFCGGGGVCNPDGSPARRAREFVAAAAAARAARIPTAATPVQSTLQ